MDTKEIEIVKEKIKGMATMVLETKVTNDKEVAEVSDKIKNVKKLGKYIKEVKDRFVAPAKEIIEQAKQMYDIPIKECINAEFALKRKAEIYLEAKEEERKKAENNIVAKVESGYIKAETAVKKLEALPEQKKTIATDSSALTMTKRKVMEISDASLIPDEYWVIDEVKLRKEALEKDKTGAEQIPGVIIKEVSSINSR